MPGQARAPGTAGKGDTRALAYTAVAIQENLHLPAPVVRPVRQPCQGPSIVGILANMPAELLFTRRIEVSPDRAFAELVIWRVPEPVRASAHAFKYRLALVVDGVCVVRYDNGAGKGDHTHLGGAEVPYTFTDPEALLADFRADVEPWRRA